MFRGNRVKNILWAFISTASVIYLLNVSRSTYLVIILFPLMFYFYENSLTKITCSKSTAVISGILGTFFSFLCGLYRYGISNEEELLFFYILISFIGMTFLFYRIFLFAFESLKNKEIKIREEKDGSPRKCVLVLIYSLGGMLLCWMPYFLSFYPAVITNDSYSQLGQSLGMIPYNNHHPMAHTFAIKFIRHLGKQMGMDANGQTALFSIIQMVLMAAVFSYLIFTLYQILENKKVCFIVWLFYAIVPYNAFYSFTMWKDVWFAGLTLAMLVSLWRLLLLDLSAVSRGIHYMAFVLFSMGFTLFRSNGYYAMYLMLPVFIYLLWKKRKIIPILCMVVIVIASILKGPVYSMLGVEKGELTESLSLPIQQIARTIVDSKELSPSQEELVAKVTDIEKIPDSYRSYLSDPMKNMILEKEGDKYIAEHKGAYLKLWAELAVKYPDSYTKALVGQTAGYWMPDIQYWVYTTQLMENEYGITRTPKLSENVGEFLTEFADNTKAAPLIGLIYSNGFATWLIIFGVGLLCVKKKRTEFVLYAPIAGVFLTLVAATPVYAEFRYYYSAFVSIPLLIIATMVSGGKDGLSSEK